MHMILPLAIDVFRSRNRPAVGLALESEQKISSLPVMSELMRGVYFHEISLHSDLIIH
jgi:hypothetical protein